MITLTSFVEAREFEGLKVSGARWAPDFARDWPEARVWAPERGPDGSAIKLRDFGEDPLPAYRSYMLSLYRTRWPQMRAWLQEVEGEHVALCCWCPFTKTARRQLHLFGSFHCHLGVVGEVLTTLGVPHVYGVEHRERMV